MTDELDAEALGTRLLRYIMTPGLLERELEADRRRSIEAWNADPYYPIRNLRAHGVEPSVAMLNTLDGPCLCERCGSATCEDGERMHPALDVCYGCGSLYCDRASCSLPPNHTGKHPFALHGSTVAA